MSKFWQNFDIISRYVDSIDIWKIKFLEDSGIAKRQTASTYLKELERIGILRGLKMGREIYYVNDTSLKALTE